MTASCRVKHGEHCSLWESRQASPDTTLPMAQIPMSAPAPTRPQSRCLQPCSAQPWTLPSWAHTCAHVQVLDDPCPQRGAHCLGSGLPLCLILLGWWDGPDLGGCPMGSSQRSCLPATGRHCPHGALMYALQSLRSLLASTG